MHNDTIKVANKIITEQDLIEIFLKMHEELEKYKKKYKQEVQENQALEYKHQNWSLKYFSGRLSFSVDFYDDTSVDFDDFNNFVGIFHNRVQDIKRLTVNYRLSHTTQHPNMEDVNYSQSIYMNIDEKKTSIDVSISSKDQKMNEVYELIKSKVLGAPIKFDRLIRKRNFITNKIAFGKGLIPSIVICLSFLLNADIRSFAIETYVAFPIVCLLLGFIIGSILNGKVLSLYEDLITDKKYAGYSIEKRKHIYVEDIDEYVSTGEILIGKNHGNLEKREMIKKLEEKYTKMLPYELLSIALISLVVLFL